MAAEYHSGYNAPGAPGTFNLGAYRGTRSVYTIEAGAHRFSVDVSRARLTLLRAGVSRPRPRVSAVRASGVAHC